MPNVELSGTPPFGDGRGIATAAPVNSSARS